MQEFTLIFRMDILNESVQPTPEQMEIYMHNWMKWINDISYKGQLAIGGNHFSTGIAKVLHPEGIETDGPYAVNNESISGYIIVFATDINDAVLIARECPILQGNGTSVEIRLNATPQNIKDVKRTD